MSCQVLWHSQYTSDKLSHLILLSYQGQFFKIFVPVHNNNNNNNNLPTAKALQNSYHLQRCKPNSILSDRELPFSSLPYRSPKPGPLWFNICKACAMSTNNLSCPTNSEPADLPIPKNLTYAVIPGTNTSAPWMVTCCAPNPVHLVSDCWLWCEITSDMISYNITSPGDHGDEALGDFDTCLVGMNRPLNESSISGLHTAGAGSLRTSRTVSVKAAALVVFLGVFGMLL